MLSTKPEVLAAPLQIPSQDRNRQQYQHQHTTWRDRQI